MGDLISRAAALDALDHERKILIEQERLGAEHIVVHHARRLIEDLPTVDAVHVVRCKDCKYRIVNDNAGKKGYMSIKAMCELDNGDVFALGRNADDPDWFCADGERRENDG